MADAADDLTRGLDAENPWPGLMPFSEATRAFFHGRDAEVAELLRRVRRERLTILFGQSGLGKTSLLCAGLFPRLRAADFLPVYIRLDWTTAQLSPVAQIKQALTTNLAEYGVEGRAPRCNETLWAYFHDKETEFWNRRNRLITPVLVLDQFEEIFTLGHGGASAEAVLDELAALIENHPPASVRAALDDDPEAARRYDFARESCNLILALREDFLPDLEGLRRRMPLIIENRMRLTRMDGRQARDVILASGSHLVAPGVAEEVIAFVAASRGRTEGETVGEADLAGLEIEPALLSIVCSELNNKRIRLGQAQITADLLEGAQQEIVAQFYQSSLAGIDPAAKLFIEEQLLTSEGYRDTRPLTEALRERGVTRPDIDKLVARRLLRIEERFGTQWVELTHDLLTGVIRQQRDLRREQTQAAQEAEARTQAERERAERAEAEAARERKEREVQTALAREAAEREHAARRLVRNTRIALGATLLTLALAIGAGIYAVKQRQLADARADEAARSYALALKAAKSNVETVDHYYKAGKIGTDVARFLLDGARNTFSGLPSEHEEAATTRARIYLFGQLAETYTTFGDLKTAREAAQTERRLADQLGNTGLEDLADLADSHNKLGQVMKLQGDLAGAFQQYRESLAEMQEAAAKDPGNARRQQDIAKALRNIGDVLVDRGDLAGALTERRASTAILVQLTAKDSTNGSWRNDLAESRRDVGSALRDRGDLTGAIGEFQASLVIMTKLTMDDPDNAGWQWMLTECQDALGDAFVDQGHLADALERFQSNVKILTQLVEKDPVNAEWQKDLAGSHNKIGVVLRAEGDFDKALSETTMAERIMATLAERDPVNLSWQRELAPSRGWVGAVLLDQGATAKALEKFRTYRNMMTELVAKDPHNATWQSFLADAHGQVAEAQRALGNFGEARQEANAALEVDEKLAAQDPQNADAQRSVLLDHQRVGNVLQAQDDLPGALKEFRSALGTNDQLVSKDPSNTLWQSDLAVSHNRLGSALMDQADYAGALKEFQTSLSIIMKLAAKDPSNDRWQRELSVYHNWVGAALKAKGDRAGAMKEFRLGLAIIERLVEKEPGNALWKQDLSATKSNIADTD
jgi:tetratricopeptide (TPR) repeat protein